MPNTRERIRMSPEEVAQFLGGPHKMQLATIGADGTPHLVTMYYALFGDLVGFWTYRSSQKARNLERDPRATILVETGEGYDQLRGVQMSGTVERLEDFDEILRVGETVAERYGGVAAREISAYLEAQARKRWAYLLHPNGVATWDHRKLNEPGEPGP